MIIICEECHLAQTEHEGKCVGCGAIVGEE